MAMTMIESDYPSPLRAWYGVAVLLLALTVAFVDRQILSLMVEPVRADLGLSFTQVSLLHGLAFVIFYTVLGIPLGRWADQRSRKWMIVTGMVIWCLATAACGLASSFNELFVARIFVGIGEATLSPAAYSLIADMFPRDKRARAMSVYSLGIIVGSGMALILGGLAVAATTGTGSVTLPVLGELRSWQAAFVIVGLPGLIVAALMVTVAEPSRKELATGDVSLSATWAFVRGRADIIALLSIGLALGGGTMAFGFGTWLPTKFILLHGWQPFEIARAMGIILLTFGLVGVLIGGWLGDRAVSRGKPEDIVGLAIIGVVAMAPAAPVIGLTGDPWLALAAYCWLNLFLGFPTALAIPMLHGITPNQFRGQITALYLFAANMIGLAIGPMLIALATDRLFASDLAVGKAMALVTSIAALIGIALLYMARARYARFVIARP